VQAAISGTAGAVKGLFVTLCSGKPCSAAADKRFPSDKLYAASLRSYTNLVILQSVSAQAPDSGLTVRANFSLTVKAMQKAWSVSSAVASTGMYLRCYISYVSYISS